MSYIEFGLIRYYRKRLVNDRGNVVREVSEYVSRYSLEKPSFLDGAVDIDEVDRFQQAREWLSMEAGMLRHQDLANYEAQAKVAHDEAVKHFKGDFVGKMRGAFEEMKLRLNELNRQLAKRDFHGLTYRFERKDSAAHREMIALIERADEPDFETLLSGSQISGDPTEKAIRRLEELAADGDADLSEIEDPRRYFEFDIVMLKDGVERTTMSKRLGTGSGGQVQVPYYVAICAALAATYYPDRTGTDGGMALAIFDEAFNRMDTAVISETIGFMADLGLQPLIAAPDKERATFAQFVDTLVGISRSGSSVAVDVQHVKPLAHRKFKEANPALIGFDGFAAASRGGKMQAAE